jgi:hypothetical protein
MHTQLLEQIRSCVQNIFVCVLISSQVSSTPKLNQLVLIMYQVEVKILKHIVQVEDMNSYVT